ncbi:MAG: hypothetical protein A3208_03570 [Candidatus Methanoprimaticola hominis]|nr:MAG: hypothetical protein A3208_03570 [Methanomassiliicoccales archaeon Mx-06]
MSPSLTVDVRDRHRECEYTFRKSFLRIFEIRSVGVSEWHERVDASRVLVAVRGQLINPIAILIYIMRIPWLTALVV